jgi:hypothetical protein
MRIPSAKKNRIFLAIIIPPDKIDPAKLGIGRQLSFKSL